MSPCYFRYVFFSSLSKQISKMSVVVFFFVLYGQQNNFRSKQSSHSLDYFFLFWHRNILFLFFCFCFFFFAAKFQFHEFFNYYFRKALSKFFLFFFISSHFMQKHLMLEYIIANQTKKQNYISRLQRTKSDKYFSENQIFFFFFFV